MFSFKFSREINMLDVIVFVSHQTFFPSISFCLNVVFYLEFYAYLILYYSFFSAMHMHKHTHSRIRKLANIRRLTKMNEQKLWITKENCSIWERWFLVVVVIINERKQENTPPLLSLSSSLLSVAYLLITTLSTHTHTISFYKISFAILIWNSIPRKIMPSNQPTTTKAQPSKDWINKVKKSTNLTHTHSLPLSLSYTHTRKIEGNSIVNNGDWVVCKVRLFVSSLLYSLNFSILFHLFDSLIWLQLFNVHSFECFCVSSLLKFRRNNWCLCNNFDLSSGCKQHHSHVYVFRFWLSMPSTTIKLRMNYRKTHSVFFCLFVCLAGCYFLSLYYYYYYYYFSTVSLVSLILCVAVLFYFIICSNSAFVRSFQSSTQTNWNCKLYI